VWVWVWTKARMLIAVATAYGCISHSFVCVVIGTYHLRSYIGTLG